MDKIKHMSRQEDEVKKPVDTAAETGMDDDFETVSGVSNERSNVELAAAARDVIKEAREQEAAKRNGSSGDKPAEKKPASVGAAVEKRELDRSRSSEDGSKADEAEKEVYREKSDPVSRKKRRRIIGTVLLMALVSGVAYYFFRAGTYKDTYIPGTYINGIDAQGRTPQEVKDIIKNQTSDFSIRVVSRGREDETITAGQVGLAYVTGDVPEVILGYQNRFKWISGYFTQTDYKVSTMTTMDDAMFTEAVSKLKCFDDETATAPRDAYVSGYIKARGYEVVPEDEGNLIIKKDQAVEMIRDAMLTMDSVVDLSSDPDLYEKPSRRSDDRELNARVTKLNKYMTIKIKYLYSDLEIGGDLIDEWLTVEDDGSLAFDDEKIEEFVDIEVAGEYDTLYMPKELETSWGPTVTVTGGSYGWQVDQKKEVEQIKADITAAQSTERDPVYSRTAASHGEHDYGDTYVEINLTAQHLYYYKNGELVIDCDFVSGLASNSKRVTPVGVYELTYKQTDRILRGQKKADGTYEYESHVNFWMPFNGGIGMHDASWRSSFGGNIYKTNGSHGCINMPYKAAKTVYNEIEKGCPVICYKLEGSSGADTYVAPEISVDSGPGAGGSSTGTKPASTKPSGTKPAATAAPAAQTSAAQPVQTQPAQIQPVQTQPASTAAPSEGVGGGPGVSAASGPQDQESREVKEGISGGPGV